MHRVLVSVFLGMRINFLKVLDIKAQPCYETLALTRFLCYNQKQDANDSGERFHKKQTFLFIILNMRKARIYAISTLCKKMCETYCFSEKIAQIFSRNHITEEEV